MRPRPYFEGPLVCPGAGGATRAPLRSIGGRKGKTMLPKRWYCLVLAAPLAAGLCGCMLGPAALKASRVRYNQAIQATTNEQLLLNLVRLQYREAPLFLEVGSISAQFQFKTNAQISGGINEGPNPVNPDELDLGAGVGYEERPTVTFTPLGGEDFVKRLLTPLRLDSILLLGRSGWSIDRVLRLTVQSMNGLDNAASASGPTPSLAPQHDKFARVSRLLRQLQKNGLLEIGYQSRTTDLCDPLPTAGIGLPDLVEALAAGYGLRTTDRGLILTEPSPVLVWRVPPVVARTAEAKEIVELLGLAPGQPAYNIRAAERRPEDPQDPSEGYACIHVAARSLMGTLSYLSHAVEIPEQHRNRGLVTTTLTAAGETFDWATVTGDLLRIHSSRSRPAQAVIAVRYRGYWYYIDDADLTSKSTFALLGQLFALQAGEVESAAPVLTLPVGG